jgi:hypothetical protein
MSGTFAPITVTVSKGSDISQDLVMKNAPSQPQDQWEPSTFTQLAEIPGGGDWIGSLGRSARAVPRDRVSHASGKSYSLEWRIRHDESSSACSVVVFYFDPNK